MVQELMARRELDEDLGAWLRGRNEVEAFDEFRAGRRAPK
jgi:hypothetical protein